MGTSTAAIPTRAGRVTDHLAAARVPVTARRAPKAVSESTRTMSHRLRDSSIEEMAIPPSTSRRPPKPPRRERTRTAAPARPPPRRDASETATMFTGRTRTTSRMPVCAPVEKPMRSGDPNGLRVTTWKAWPAAARAAPAPMARRIRGARHRVTTSVVARPPRPRSAWRISPHSSAKDPTRRARIPRQTMPIRRRTPTRTTRGSMRTDALRRRSHQRPAAGPGPVRGGRQDAPLTRAPWTDAARTGAPEIRRRP